MTKREIQKMAKGRGIEIAEERHIFNSQRWVHIHAYAPPGKIFDGSTVHNAMLYDGPLIKGMWEEIDASELDLMECEPDCDECEYVEQNS